MFLKGKKLGLVTESFINLKIKNFRIGVFKVSEYIYKLNTTSIQCDVLAKDCLLKEL